MKRQRVLVANRGEIAKRIISSCKDLGIETVGIYSDGDKLAGHYEHADYQVRIGPADSSKSYLNKAALLAAAEMTGCTAIHPGYGFLSESDSFAKLCEDVGLIWIGPSAESIRAMGDKVESKRLAKELGIPLVPGSEGAVDSAEEAIEVVKSVGYPILLKASKGGGGRGIARVDSDEELNKKFKVLQREAELAFGDPALFVEKLIENPHHIEFQIFGDGKGKVVCFGDRECSLQRRNQKVLEEAPSPNLPDDKYFEMAKIIEKALSKIKYRNAGTVEFVMDSAKNLYFIEMNTRIQVEHPVTEMVCGKDLISLQLKLAFDPGYKLKSINKRANGHAIECRINAETFPGMLPSPGLVKNIKVPFGYGVRFDSHLGADTEVPQFYDSMVGKMIVHSNDRTEAIMKMKRCLKELKVNGISTNNDLHRLILSDEDFKNGDYNTSFLKGFLEKLNKK